MFKKKRIKLVQMSLCIVTSKAPKEEIYLKNIVPNKPHHKDPAVA